ncbi:protein IQ-DOMAIN 9-like isoform X2 [Malania oleifera]|uniref:protein IQ-DOMAIN 9-like isoform X2 n=1 Tax=Malania oleifera TaxID=397392 RepID=UPI0025AE4E02|nr:protein IQ-DOMAIN 9-like isoform X2 [Malania oleifera]XP_057947949.1 protein IQ-DOMAIN 9-like isoform X2 [Malania oleifera]XP_057947950.1 protein IQ-DOMAIN 9-like isoform X2 [Malania oleifera]XP_057947951.1 protein IQ-DOMAIN 9-like isoform X2 [Malania oleifera]XP_057947952.1 protein IQ-DOMAIN 9-like isoform X2 [Malania oleifera]XP_057947953.1 protein IQ-DOMAIN 9-like isoform X2 [Malania oleifera]XP_057947954.1 protein IQ-DOMAIN 9-like isoform X2 [Malania oleifera]XP_057947955.1 protein IQ
MGSGDWFKTIISLKKVKHEKKKQGSLTREKSTGLKWRHCYQKESTNLASSATRGDRRALCLPVEDVAATRIQSAFRAFMGRRMFCRLKGTVRLQILTQGHSVKKQASTMLSRLHSWSRIQAQIRARRISMVTECQIRQKKLENQLKLEAKLHDLEVDWCGGSETMDKILARIHQREEAAVKRERAMAYAFSHQWRANSIQNQGLGTYELGKANWGWSWMERWIAARPWETRVSGHSPIPKKGQSNKANQVSKKLNTPKAKVSVSVKPDFSNEKGTTKARRLSYSSAEKPAEARRLSYLTAEKPAAQGKSEVEEADNEKEQFAS